MSTAFWRGFWEACNPFWWLAWALWAVGHVISLPMYRWDSMAWLYPAYNRMMLASCALCERFDFSSPWGRKP